jgi:hypothetical protein
MAGSIVTNVMIFSGKIQKNKIGREKTKEAALRAP